MGDANEIFEVAEAAFEKEVLEHSRTQPVMVDFWAKWCAPCVKLKPILEEAARRAAGSFRLVKIDIDASPNLANAFGIASIPAVMMFRDGKPVDSFVGLISPEDLDRFIARSMPQPADQLLAKAREAKANGQSSEAADLCRQALEIDPGQDGARILLAGVLLEEKEKPIDIAAIETLLEPLADSGQVGREVLHLKAKVFFAKLAQAKAEANTPKSKAAELCAKAGEKARLGEVEAAIEDLLAAGELDFKLAKGPVKEGLVHCFHLLGEGHPKLASYRNQLMMLLT